MPRPSRPWFRIYVEMFSDRKLLRLHPGQRWLWVAIMGAARESPKPGSLMIAEGVPMTNVELAHYADMRSRDIAPALSIMLQLSMIDIEDGVISVRNWDSRQFESDNVNDRVRAFRERSNGHPSNVTTGVTSNVTSNTPDARGTETETETEKYL